MTIKVSKSIMRSDDSILASIGVLFLYLQTLYPSISGGDAGELLSEACQLGTAHPPRYPLFTILAHVAIPLMKGFDVFVWFESSRLDYVQASR